MLENQAVNEQTSPEFIALQEALAGRYSLGRELGRGGMAVVYLTHEVALDRPVALKLLPPAMAAEPDLRERFIREARTAAKLSQPNIVPIYAVDEVDRFVFFTMAYVEGESLGATIRNRGALPAGDAARILREVAWALAYAHAQGVVHRDVKPDNILLEAGSGRALVTDFGIAQVSEAPGITGRGEVLGTAEFMSPEQASGETVDERSDIYSLGVVGFYMLTGRLPFEGDTVASILAKHITQAPPLLSSVAPEVPQHLARAMDRCLAKDPADRFANGEDLAAAMSRSIEVRREIPVPLRAFVEQMRERFRGLPLYGVWLLSYVGIITFLMLEGATLPAVIIAAFWSAMAAAPAGMLARMIRQLLESGYSHQELLLALKTDLEIRSEELAFEHRGAKRSWVDRVAFALLFGGLAAMGAGTAAAVVFDLMAISDTALTVIALLAGGGFVASMVALPVAATRRGRKRKLPGKWWLKFWESRGGKWLFKVARVGLKRLPGASTAYRPTEMAIGMAADRLFEELPKAVRKGLSDLPSVVTRLETDARNMRNRVEQLDKLLADVGGAQGGTGPRSKALPGLTAERDALAEDLKQAREVARTRLQDAVAALETVRLDLLRMHAGSGTQAGVTANLSKARELSDDIARLLEGQEEVEQALKQIDVEV